MHSRPGSGGNAAAARLRGAAGGAVVGALAIAAHGAAGGGVPRSMEVAVLLAISALTGNLAANDRVLRWFRPQLLGSEAARLALVLTLGQWAAHTALAVLLSHHGDATSLLHLPTDGMLAAHLLAAGAGAALIHAAERLYLVASGVLRALLRLPAAPLAPRVPATHCESDVRAAARHFGAVAPRAPPSGHLPMTGRR